MTGLRKVSILVIPLLALGLITGCAITIGTPGQAPTPTPIPLRTSPDEPIYKVTRGDLIETTEAVGRVVASVEEELYFQVGGRVITVNVSSGNRVEEGELLAELDTGTLKDQLAKAQVSLEIAQLRLREKEGASAEEREAGARDLERAQLNLEIAKLRLIQAQQSAGETAGERELDLIIAKNSVENAKRDLLVVQIDPDSAERLRTLEYEAAWFRNNYWEAQNKFAEGKIDQQKLDWEYSNMLAAEEKLTVARLNAESALANAEDQVTKAEETLREAQENLKVGPAADYNLLILQKNVELAQLEVDRHKERVENPEREDIDLQLLRKNVESAQVEVNRLQTSVAAAQVMAPFSGEITDLDIRVGDTVQAYEPVMSIALPMGIEAQASISVADLAWISIGDPVTVVKLGTVQKIYEGKVTYMPSTELGRRPTGREAYTRFSIETLGADLKMGDVAKMVLVLRRQEDVLIVPTDAVHSIRGGFYVQVWEAGRKKLIKIERGIVTADGTEVLKGLEEGQEVLGR